MSLLEIDDLHTYFDTKEGTVRAVEGVSLEIGEGEIVGLVGESGSGKSVTARSILDLVESPGRIVEGDVRFDGEDLRSLSQSELQRIRGERMSMVFQDSSAAFNPTQTVGRQLHDVLRTHRDGSVHPLVRMLGLDHRDAYRERVVGALDEVGIPEPESRYDDYPHEFSGGMIQRAMIAMAMLCEPDLVVADEPTTALDVTIERQILGLVKRLVRDRGTSVLWITHDLSVVANLCDRIVVMYAGKVMEEGPTDEVLTNPRHPYTRGLLSSVPRYDRPDEELNVIRGDVPDPLARPRGCRFADRCPDVHDQCHEAHPPMYAEGDHEAACYLLESDPETEANPR